MLIEWSKLTLNCKNCHRDFEISELQRKLVLPWFLFGRVAGYRWYLTRCPYCRKKSYNRPSSDN